MTWDGMYVYLGKVELITQSSKGKRAGCVPFMLSPVIDLYFVVATRHSNNSKTSKLIILVRLAF